MPQTTRTPRATRTAPRTGSGRFARPGAAQTRARRSASARPTPRTRPRQQTRKFGRKPKQQKGIAGAITGLLPTGAAAKATPSSKKGKAGGVAALAAAAGVAFANRDKLAGLVNRKGGDQQPQEPASTTTTPPVSSANATPPIQTDAATPREAGGL